MERLRGLWISDLVAPTGFSRVSHSILKYLSQKEFDITGLGVNYKGDPHPYPMPIFPAILGGDVYGLGRLNTILEAFEFDFIFILNDTWVVNRYLEQIKKMPVGWKRPKIVVYFPVDSSEHDTEWYKNFDIVDKVVVYTKFGYDVVKKINPHMEVEIIPHGVDTTVFNNNSFTSRSDARMSLFGNSRPELLNSYIFLNANRNQPRKRLDITLKAFGLFMKDKPNENIRIYMHSGVRDSAIETPKIADRYGVAGRLIVTNLNQGIQVVPDEKLNAIYNSCNVGLNTSMGEGWGLTNVEHAVTGAPQIVPDHSACKEVFYDCGLLVPVVTDFTFDHTATVGMLVKAEDVANSMQKIWEDKRLYSELSEQSIKKFTSEEYQWSNIAAKWRELFLGL